MIRKQKNTHLLLKNKYFRVLLIVLLLTILVVGIIRYWDRYRLVHSPIYPMLQGKYELVLDASYVDWASEAVGVGLIIQIHHDIIDIPTIKINNSKMKNLNAIDQRKLDEGCWKVISNSPDSILIDSYPHPLHGKYKVTFMSCKSGSLGYTTTNYVLLDNDSTHLCLMKVK